MDLQLAALYAEIDRLDFVAFFERLDIRPWRKQEHYMLYRCRALCYRSSFLAIDTKQNICIHVDLGSSRLYKTNLYWHITDSSACHWGVLTFAHQYFREDPKTIALNREKYSLIGPAVTTPEKARKLKSRTVPLVQAAAGEQHQPVSEQLTAVGIPETFLESPASP